VGWFKNQTERNFLRNVCVTFQAAVISGYQNYANFHGRASRSGYWWWTLFQALASSAIGVVFGYGVMTMDPATMVMAYQGGIVMNLWTLANLLPNLAMSVRRLHDIGRSGWWLLLMLIPLIGFIIVLVWLCQKSDTGDNAYGPQTA